MYIVMGTNFNANDMKSTLNIELIKTVYDAINMGIPLRWFYMSWA
jgi:hypothetical protein